jgi:streptomycin 6-kinase
VTEWAADLPDRVGRFAALWSLTVDEPFPHGASSVAYPVTRADGTPAVLKLTPDVPFSADQAAVLRLFAPSGRVPEVLAEADGALLLTAIRPGTAMCDLPVHPGPAKIGALLVALHGVPVPGRVPGDLREWTGLFLGRAARRMAEPAVAAYLRQSDVDLALAERDRLLATTDRIALLHGDLHLTNMLVGEAGLAAIDPKAALGDPCFDAIDYVAAGAGRDGIGARAAGLAMFGYDPDRVLAWTRVAVPALVPPLVTAGDIAGVGELVALLRGSG